jgi:hypothetical protein
MKLPKENSLESTEFECSKEFKAKKLVIEKRQNRILSELGKTVSELKNGVYQLDRMPED